MNLAHKYCHLNWRFSFDSRLIPWLNAGLRRLLGVFLAPMVCKKKN